VHGRDRRLSSDDRAVGVVGDQGQALDRRRKHPALYAQEPSGLIHALRKPSGHVRQRRDDDVPYRVVREVPPTLEAIVEDLGEASPFGQGHETVPHVARRRHPEFLPDPPARTPIVRHRHDRDQVPDTVPEPS
jgi:hypothetical protein